MHDPETMVMIIFPLTFAIIIIVLVFAIKRKNRRHPLEQGRLPVYSDDSCGGWIGTMRSSWPFVRISIYEDFLVVAHPMGTILLRYDEITDVAVERVLFTMGLVIRHRREDIHKRIVIWSGNKEELQKHIAGAMRGR